MGHGIVLMWSLVETISLIIDTGAGRTPEIPLRGRSKNKYHKRYPDYFWARFHVLIWIIGTTSIFGGFYPDYRNYLGKIGKL